MCAAQLVSMDGKLEPLLGRERLLLLLRMWPMLLNHSPETLAWNFEAVEPVFGMSTLATMIQK